MSDNGNIDERDDIVELIDEEGKKIKFKYLDTIELDEEDYVVLMPLDEEDEAQEEGKVVILKIEQNDAGEDTFVKVDDDKTLNTVFEEFKTRDNDEYDFEE